MLIRFNIALRDLVLKHMKKNCIAYPQTMMKYSFGNRSCVIQLSDKYFSTSFLDRDAAGELSLAVFGTFNEFDLYKHISEEYFADLVNVYCTLGDL